MAADSSAAELESVARVTARLQALLEHARTLKPASTVEPPLPRTALIPEVDALHEGTSESYDNLYKLSTAETAARQLFYSLVHSTSISTPEFVEVWNLLDILSLCGDRGTCAPELVVWLIEELLESQTTAGCKVVFDYLESRRDRLTAKDFHKKNFAFLRACNELLRRLSRAEDAMFCGRVFFFLFQTFPLGDKSSVNLRGEFHVENTTEFESPDGEDGMDVDEAPSASETPAPETPQPPTKPGQKATGVKKKPPPPPEEVVMSNSELYPIFWRLQQDFSDPTRLFGASKFARFKKGLAATIAKFKKTPTVVQTKTAASAEEHGKRGVKRKLGEDAEMVEQEVGLEDEGMGEHIADTYNPKYLTSHDLFALELSDLAFQRHILVQSLILIDFLLSLTEKAKKKIALVTPPNKGLIYAFVLSAEDAKWCTDTRALITAFLQQVPTPGEGRFYHRAVETVLARDRNWVRWKVESCPIIVRDPVSTDSALEARKGAREVTQLRRLPKLGAGGTDMSFLLQEGQERGLEALKAPSRFTAPTFVELIDGIRTDRLDLEMAMDDQETASLQNAIDNKTWRALRQKRAEDLGWMEKVDPNKNLEDIFDAEKKKEEEAAERKEKGEVETEEGLKVEAGEQTPVPSSAPEVTITDGEGGEEMKVDAPAESDEAKADGEAQDVDGMKVDAPAESAEAKADEGVEAVATAT